VLVLPSFNEGFGLPVLEAMTIGVPVVASTRGALPEVLGDSGLLVEPDDSDGLAEAIARMLFDRHFSAQAAASGLRRSLGFSWRAAAEALDQAYRQAMDSRGIGQLASARAR
jgi:glycosyltransferase involved in cell wall biosynthesis